MSWVTRVQQDISIELGDGRVFTPQYLNAQYIQEYNLAVFNFPNVAGSLVRRREPKGRKFALEIYFQGDDHLDIAEDFRRSAADQRHWHITHPFYDDIRCQPQTLRFDNTKQNISKISGVVIETIPAVFPRGASLPADEINARKITLDETSAQNYAAQVEDLQSSEVTTISQNVDVVESTTNDIIETQEEQVDFRNKVIAAQQAITNAIQEPLEAAREIQTVLNFPNQIVGNIRNRVNTLVEQLDRILVSLGAITGISRNQKVYYETSGVTLVSAACTATLVNAEFDTRQDVDDVVNIILDMYNNFIENLDSLETDNQTEPDSYTPNPQNMLELEQLTYLTLSNLFDIALETQQEHTIVNEADSNMIILTHRVYGLDNEDENIERFKRTNNIGLKEILLIKKDREIKYFI